MIVLFFLNLMLMGWWVAFGVVALVLRHGVGAEALAWSLLFGLTPFSAVFYPSRLCLPRSSRSPSPSLPPMCSRECARS